MAIFTTPGSSVPTVCVLPTPQLTAPMPPLPDVPQAGTASSPMTKPMRTNDMMRDQRALPAVIGAR